MTYTVTEQDLEKAISAGGKDVLITRSENGENTRKQIGPLSVKQIAQILTESANALNKIYPVPGNNPLTNKVDSRGRYGAYRLTIQQLIDAAYIEKQVISWAQGGLQLHGDGPYVAERRSSYADEALKKFDGDKIDFAVPRTEERNNVQYYLLNNEPPGYIRHFNVVSPISNFVLNQLVDQNFWGYNFLEFTYKLFITARIFDEDDLIFETDEERRRESVRALSGLLTVALCESYDAATSLASGREKINTDGISSKYWYAIGYNAIAASENEKKPHAEPEPVKSPDVTAVTNVSSEAISEEPTPETAAAPTSTTTDNGAPNAGPQKSDTPPPAASPEQVATAATPEKPKATSAFSSGTGYTIDYQLEGETFSAVGVLVGTNRIVCSGSDLDRNVLKQTLISQLDSRIKIASSKTNLENPIEVIKSVGTINLYWSGNNATITVKISGLTVKSITVSNTDGYLASIAISDLVDELAALKNSIQDPTVVLTYTQIINYFTGSQYKNDIETVKEAYSAQQQGVTDAQALEALKNDILNNFLTVTEPLENQKNTPKSEAQETTNPDGTISTTVTTVHDDGSKTTFTTTTNSDGTITTEKTVVPVAPPADVAPPKGGEDLEQVRDPVNASPAVASGRNSIATYDAINQPNNSDVIDSDPSKGFKDPNQRYPKKESVNKPDTNTLAVGVNSPNINPDPRSPAGDRKSTSPGASPAARNATRKREVKTAGRNGTTWSQPESPYAAQYPYNKVFGGESGHALEIDDTPGAERLNWAHRSGTFDEIGPDGTKVVKIVGDGYTIYDNDGYILIEGSANVHLAGACNVYIAGDTNLTMHGKASIDVHNDLDLNVGGHIAVSAGKGIFVRNQGIFSLDNVGDIEMRSKGKLTQEVVGTYNITTTSGFNMTSKADSNVKISGVSYTTSTGDMNFCTDGILKAKSAGDLNLLTDAVMKQESSGDFNIKSGGAINEEGAGNISLKAPLVTSSPIDTATIDVTTANITTLNAGTTNLVGNDESNGDVTNIRGGTTASVTAPASAAAAAEADCASVAPLSKPVPLELPVSISKGSAPASSAGVGAVGGGGAGNGGSELDGPALDGGEIDSDGKVIDQNDCGTGEGNDSTDSSTENGLGDSAGGSEAAGPFQSRPPYGNSDVQNGKQLPPIPNMNPKRPDLSFRLSLGHTLGDLCGSDGFKGVIIPFGKFGTIDILRNLRALCVHFIDPVKKQFPGIKINSGYRPYGYVPKGGAKISPHMTGGAVDLRIAAKPSDGRAHMQLAEWIAKNCPQADQILFEKSNGRYWVHVGIAQPRNPGGAPRGEKMTFLEHEPYRKGLSASKQGFVMV